MESSSTRDQEVLINSEDNQLIHIHDQKNQFDQHLDPLSS